MRWNPVSWFRKEAERPTWIGFVDLHTHILPGLDDGPKDLEGTLEMLQVAHRSGTRTLTATPHMFLDPYDNHDAKRVRRAFEETVRILRKREQVDGFGFIADLEFRLGAENYVSPLFLDALREDRVLSINDSQYLLVEIPPILSRVRIEEIVKQILKKGLIPLLAHVERIYAIQQDPNYASSLIRWGCVLQMNGTALERKGQRRTGRICRTLLDQQLVQIIASDGHSSSWRNPRLDRIRDSLVQNYSEERAKSLLLRNPSRILAGETL